MHGTSFCIEHRYPLTLTSRTLCLVPQNFRFWSPWIIQITEDHGGTTHAGRTYCRPSPSCGWWQSGAHRIRPPRHAQEAPPKLEQQALPQSLRLCAPFRGLVQPFVEFNSNLECPGILSPTSSSFDAEHLAHAASSGFLASSPRWRNGTTGPLSLWMPYQAFKTSMGGTRLILVMRMRRTSLIRL